MQVVSGGIRSVVYVILHTQWDGWRQIQYVSKAESKLERISKKDVVVCFPEFPWESEENRKSL
jgi:hypothetical protein